MLQKIAVIVLLLAFAAIPKSNVQASDATIGSGSADSCTETAFTKALDYIQKSGGGSLSFNCGARSVVIVFSSPKTITSQVQILGGGMITLSGNDATSLFSVAKGATLGLNNIVLTNARISIGNGGAILSSGNLILDGVRMANNLAVDYGKGGAIASFGNLEIYNSQFEANQGSQGGALYLETQYSHTKIVNSTFLSNRAQGLTVARGGAIALNDSAVIEIHASHFYWNAANYGGAIDSNSTASTILIDQNSSFQNNSVTFEGGAINSIANLDIYNSSFLQNSANSDRGGAISLTGTGKLNGNHLTFHQNTARGNGGAIYSDSWVDISYSTFAFNTAGESTSWMDGSGGAIYSTFRLGLKNSTLSGNFAKTSGTAIWSGGTFAMDYATIYGNSFSTVPLISINNTIILFSSNLFGRPDTNTGPNCEWVTNPVISTSFNIADDSSCNLTASNDLVVDDLKLAPLADHGGPTWTHLPLPGSPAIDFQLSDPSLTDDQRGLPRPLEGPVDIGAVEVQPGEWKIVFLPLVRR